jgi:hypothetical protein
MEINFQELLPGLTIAFPFGIGTIAFFLLGFKRLSHLASIEQHGNSKERFKDTLVSNIYFASGSICLLLGISLFQMKEIKWGILPLLLCFGIAFIPIGVIGTYWRSYLTKKVFGGFMPVVRVNYGVGQPYPAEQRKIDPAKLKIPRRTTITAALVALFVSSAVYFVLYIIGWNGSPSFEAFKLFMSGTMGVGIFMTILIAAVSRRLQKLRNGETLDDDKDT